jgi:hypothetical protein
MESAEIFSINYERLLKRWFQQAAIVMATGDDCGSKISSTTEQGVKICGRELC